jgi:hypothetical protein
VATNSLEQTGDKEILMRLLSNNLLAELRVISNKQLDGRCMNDVQMRRLMILTAAVKR